MKTEKFNEFCTFGHAVHADGFYKIKSRKIPSTKHP